MIAPIRPPQDRTSAALREARRVVALLLPAEEDRATTAPPVPAWQAWLLTTWMTVTAAVFLWVMFGSWRGD
jgi:hypothetical protein